MPAKYPVLCGAVTLTSSNNALSVTENGGVRADVISLPIGTYFLNGDGGADDLAKILENELNDTRAQGYTISNTYTVVYVADVGTGVNASLIISSAGDNFELEWADGSTTLDAAVFGFSAATTTQATSATNDLSTANTWCSNQPLVLIDPDTEGAPGGIFAHVTPNGQQYVSVMQSDQLWRDLMFRLVSDDRAWREQVPTDTARAYQSWRRLHRDGTRFELYTQSIASGSVLSALGSGSLVGTYVLDADPLESFSPQVHSRGTQLYNWTSRVREYVS